MALGFGFNKQKVLAAAEKYVQQGKIQNAITEYEKVTKEDPKDLTVLNTIGDLYSRVGNSDKAGFYFKKVGDHYATDGFTVKAIAMYKKLVKLVPGNTEAILKLAELYTQQGLYNDARAQYVLVADSHMKASEYDAAAKIFQKMLELDPENSTMQSKLADLYVKLGKKDEARNIFFNAAQSLYAKGAFDAADEACGRVLALDAGNADALMLRGAVAADSGDGASAVRYLEQIANLDSRSDALRALIRAHLLLNQRDQAEPIANKLLSVHNDIGGLTMFAESLMAAGDLEKAIAVYDQYADKLLAANPTGIITALHSSINKIKDNAPALQILRSVYLKARDTTHLNEVSELLAHAYVQAGDLEKARDLYKELSELEPENPLHAQNYKQILARLGDSASRPLTAEEGSQAFMVDELESTTATIEQTYPEEITAAVRNAVTESELFDSYNLPAKAIGPLEAVLPQAPEDAQLNQRLAGLYARAERFEDAARCCEIMARLHVAAGHTSDAKQFTDMAAKYRERAASAPAAPAAHAAAPPPEMPAAAADFGFEVSVEPPAPAAEAAAPAAAEFGFEVTVPPAEAPAAEPAREVDLSSEWETMVSPEAAAPAAPAADPAKEALDEAQFYLSQAMYNEAEGALDKLAQVAPNHPELAGLRAQLAAATAPPPAAAEPTEASVAEFVFDTAALGEPQPEAAPPPPPPPPAPKPAPKVEP